VPTTFLMMRWIVAVAGILAVVGPGAVYSFSLLGGPLAAAFGWLPSEVTWAFAIANFSLAVGGLLGGLLSDRKGPRLPGVIGVALWAGGNALCALLAGTHSIVLLYLCYGVVGGFGCGMVYMAVLNSVIRWFPQARGFGGGLVIMGFGLGSFVYSAVVKSWAPFASISAGTQAYTSALASAVAAHTPFAASQYLLSGDDTARLMGLFLWSGVAFAVLGGAAIMLLEHPPVSDPKYAAQYEGRQFTLPEMVGDARFYILWAMLFVNVFGGVAIISNAVPLMRELTGMPAADAAGLYAMLAICNGLGRLFWGTLSDRLGRRLTFAILFGAQTLAFVALDSSGKDITLVAASMALLLLCYGGGFGVMPAFNVDFFGVKNFGGNYGMQISAWGMAAVVGTAFISTLKDATGSFAGMMQPIAVVVLVAMFLPLILGETHKDGEASQRALSLKA
jgi:OFA family oxalate/formate antiporter-like MFS transporter